MKITFLLTLCSAVSLPMASAVSIIDGGSTSVLLDVATLESAASLALSGVSADVTAPGALGAGSVAFAINTTVAPSLPTTFNYTAVTLSPFSGEINHTGSVFFNSGGVEVGNFRIGFDNSRAAGLNSGFFVESTTGIAAILFDLSNPVLDAIELNVFQVSGDLAVSPEFAGFLQTNGLAASDLTGADVGDAQISATAIPEPSSILAVTLAGLFGLARRRR